MAEAEKIMHQALALARRGEGRTRPNPAVGSVVVSNGQVVGEGFHPRAGEPHAEIFALRQAGGKARGADLYVTLEPCSHQGRTGPCADAVIAAGIGRVFIGTSDPNPQVSGRGIARMQQAGLVVQVGILEQECRRLIAPFAKHVTQGVPLVTLKAALTLDGNCATATGDSQWISNEKSRQQVHRVRDKVDAIMVGIGTVLRDNPRLTTRLPEGGRDPLRIVVDGRLRIPENAAILDLESAAATVIATTARAPQDKVQRLQGRGIEVWQLPEAEGHLDLRVLMRRLGDSGIQSLLLEGGSGLNSAALACGIIDRVMLFMGPKLLGGFGGKGLFAGSGVERLSDAFELDQIRVSRFDNDILIEGEVRRCSPD